VRLAAVAITAPLSTTTHPIGTSPAFAAFSAAFSAKSMKEGVIMAHLLACLGDEIMRYFSRLEHNTGAKRHAMDRQSRDLALRNRTCAKTLLGTPHSAKVDTGFA
jgi:hypothetical protein